MAKKKAKKAAKKRSLNTTGPQVSVDRDWEAENAADTLMRAEEIRGNPRLLKRAEKRLQKKAAVVKKAMR